MVEKLTSYSRSFSDSELNERSFGQLDSDKQRTKRYSGSQLFCSKTVENLKRSMDCERLNKSLVDYEIFDEAISSLENNADRTMNSERNYPETFESCHKENIVTESRVFQHEHTEDEKLLKEDMIPPECSSVSSTTVENTSSENIENFPDTSRATMPLNNSIHQETHNSSLAEEDNSIENKQFSGRSVHDENSVLYPILEVPTKENFLVPSEDFIGEPRCLALKKYATDDDMDDALELNFAEFDDDDDFINEQPPKNKIPSKNVQKKNSNDMFLDDDEPVVVGDSKNTNYTDVANTKNDWDRPVVEKEEGELTPDLYSTALSDGGESKKTRPKKQSAEDTKESNQTREKQPERKESNQDFFLKINRCFRQLEREFCNMHVPRGSRRMIGQLQNTLCNVDRMKRRLAFLIDSAKNVSSDKSKNTSNSKDEKRSSSRRGSFDDGKSKLLKTEGGRPERSTSDLLRDTLRSQKEAEARMNRHIRRTAASIAYAGTKQEKQRIQSLFKRQMNLITQHVIQKNDSGKNQNVKAGGSRTKKESEKARDETPKVPELKTLDEMEAFLAVLKVQKSQKEEILATENQKKQQGPLRFTTKKGLSVVERRQQPVLLLGANPPHGMTQTQVGDDVEETEWEKQAEVLKAMSDKRKEILKNKKDYEEVRLLQEQLQKLTNMDVPAETSEVSLSSTATKFRVPKEQNVCKDIIKEGKENLTKEVESKKSDGTCLKEEITESISVKKDPKEMRSIKPTFLRRSSGCEVESHEIIQENSKRQKKRKIVEEEENSSSETSKSDRELKDPILKKRKRTESGGKLSTHNKYSEMERKSQRSRHRSNIEEATIIDGFDEKLPEELMSKKLLIVGDKNMALLNERFCLKVKGNQIYLKKMGRTKRDRRGRREQKNRRRASNERIGTIDDGGEKAGPSHSLKEMEDFLQQLRSKKKVLSEERDCVPQSNQQSREMKFMARIQAKRKAKLMACVSAATPDITEKEAKFLKDLEDRARDPRDSPDTEKRKQKLMQKIREETDAIVLQQKQQVIHVH